MMRMSLQSVEKVGRQEKVHIPREVFLFLMIPTRDPRCGTGNDSNSRSNQSASTAYIFSASSFAGGCFITASYISFAF
jgi:hypothetical protein